MRKLQKTFFEIFVLSQLVNFSPLPKMLVVAVPFIAVMWYIKKNPLVYTFQRVLLVGALGILYIPFYLIIRGGDFYIANFVMIFIFYGAFFFLFITKPPPVVDIRLLKNQYLPFIKWLIIIEAIVGIVQIVLAGRGIDSGAGDFVQGTINLLSFANDERGANNLFFVINMCVLVTLYYLMSEKKSWTVVGLGVLSIFLASAVHVCLSYIVAALGMTLLTRRRQIIKQLVYISALIVFFSTYTAENFSSVGVYASQIMEIRNLKVLESRITMEDMMEEIEILLFGYGMGQYSSRAALVSSGYYFYERGGRTGFRNPLPFRNTTEAFESNVKDLWVESITSPGQGSSVMTRPVYSLLSLLSEGGVVLFMTLFILYLRQLFKWVKAYNQSLSSRHKNLLRGCILLSMFFLVLSFFENYLEMPQAIFSGLIFIKSIGNAVSNDTDEFAS